MNKYDKILSLAIEFEKETLSLKKKAALPAVLLSIGTYLMYAWSASLVAEMASAEIPRFKSAQQGVQRAIQLAKGSNITKNKDVVDQFIADGQNIIPLFNIVENMQTPSAKKLKELQYFIEKTGSFINNISAVEAAIQENMSYFEYAGHLLGKHMGFGIDWTNLKAFQNLLPKLIPTLSLVLSKANAMYSSVRIALEEEIRKAQSKQESASPESTSPEESTIPYLNEEDSSSKPGQSSAEDLFSGFSQI